MLFFIQKLPKILFILCIATCSVLQAANSSASKRTYVLVPVVLAAAKTAVQDSSSSSSSDEDENSKKYLYFSEGSESPSAPSPTRTSPPAIVFICSAPASPTTTSSKPEHLSIKTIQPKETLHLGKGKSGSEDSYQLSPEQEGSSTEPEVSGVDCDMRKLKAEPPKRPTQKRRKKTGNPKKKSISKRKRRDRKRFCEKKRPLPKAKKHKSQSGSRFPLLDKEGGGNSLPYREYNFRKSTRQERVKRSTVDKSTG